jgi:hypothetical protein
VKATHWLFCDFLAAFYGIKFGRERVRAFNENDPTIRKVRLSGVI